MTGVAQLGYIFAEVKISWVCRRSRNNQAIVARSFDRGSQKAACRAPSQSVARGRTEIDKTEFRAPGRQPGPGDRSSHADDDALRIIRINSNLKLVQQYVFREQLPAPKLAERGLFRQRLIPQVPRAQVDTENSSHVPAREPRSAHGREKVAVTGQRGCHISLTQKLPAPFPAGDPSVLPTLLNIPKHGVRAVPNRCRPRNPGTPRL